MATTSVLLLEYSSVLKLHDISRAGEMLVLILKAVSCFMLENEHKKQEGLPCRVFVLCFFFFAWR